jgi:hypothetical protein
MRIKLAQFIIQHRLIFSLFLAVGLIAINSAMAAEPGAESPLKVTSLDFGNIQLDMPVWVKVDHLDNWLRKSGHDTSKFVLCLDGIPFNGIHPSWVRNGYLGFDLRPTGEAQNAWKNFVSPPIKRDGKDVDVTVRLDSAILDGSCQGKLTVFKRPWIHIFVASVMVLVILIICLSNKTDIIREAGDQPRGIDKYGRPNRKPYSLARTQMACWFLVVLVSYVFIWMLTDDIKTLTSTALALMGISAATALGSAVVDSSKRADQENLIRIIEEKMNQVEVEVVRLRGDITSLNETSNATPGSGGTEQQREVTIARQGDFEAKKTEVGQLKQQIQELKEKAEPVPSRGFLNDILSDNNGISFNRFQMFAWTVVLIVVFMWSVLRSLAMLDFDATLLALMGISGATFIGFKLPTQLG